MSDRWNPCRKQAGSKAVGVSSPHENTSFHWWPWELNLLPPGLELHYEFRSTKCLQLWWRTIIGINVLAPAKFGIFSLLFVAFRRIWGGWQNSGSALTTELHKVSMPITEQKTGLIAMIVKLQNRDGERKAMRAPGAPRPPSVPVRKALLKSLTAPGGRPLTWLLPAGLWISAQYWQWLWRVRN